MWSNSPLRRQDASARIPAIKVYLDFGFKPNMQTKDAAEAWAEVKGKLEHPLLEGVGV